MIPAGFFSLKLLDSKEEPFWFCLKTLGFHPVCNPQSPSLEIILVSDLIHLVWR